MTTETRSCFLHGDYTGKERCPGCIHEIPPPMAFRDAFEAMAAVAGDDEALARLQPPSRDSREAVIEKLEEALNANQALADELIREALALLRAETGASR